MNVLKHGVNAETELKKEIFTCEQCGCEFAADYDEYYVNKGSSISGISTTVYTYSSKIIDVYICSCPECHKILTKNKERIIETPIVTYTGMNYCVDQPDSVINIKSE